MSQGSGGTVDDQISLDVHSINELNNRGVSATDDMSKYDYTADDQGHYGWCFCQISVCLVHSLQTQDFGWMIMIKKTLVGK